MHFHNPAHVIRHYFPTWFRPNSANRIRSESLQEAVSSGLEEMGYHAQIIVRHPAYRPRFRPPLPGMPKEYLETTKETVLATVADAHRFATLAKRAERIFGVTFEPYVNIQFRDRAKADYVLTLNHEHVFKSQRNVLRRAIRRLLNLSTTPQRADEQRAKDALSWLHEEWSGEKKGD